MPFDDPSALNPLFLNYFTLYADNLVPDGDFSLGLLKGLNRQLNKAAAAGYLHDHDGKGIDLGIVEPGFDLFDIYYMLQVHLLPSADEIRRIKERRRAERRQTGQADERRQNRRKDSWTPKGIDL